jgi:hypothetical protein
MTVNLAKSHFPGPQLGLSLQQLFNYQKPGMVVQVGPLVVPALGWLRQEHHLSLKVPRQSNQHNKTLSPKTTTNQLSSCK